MKVKICGIRNEDDLAAAVKSGADAVGFLMGQVYPSRDFILPGTAARLVRSLPPCISPVIVTHLTEPEEIIDLVDRTGITTIQLHGGSTLAQVQQLRDALPPVAKLILTIHPSGEADFVNYMDFYCVADAFLIDSINEETGQVGGTGLIGNWALAAKFVKESPIPVMLAGGLTPINVADAIHTVSPYGVDANSGLKDKESRTVIPDLCRAFVKAAKEAI